MKPKDEPRAYSSPACYLHEFQNSGAPPLTSWEEIKQWRKARREEIITRRAAREATERQRLSRPVVQCLLDHIDVNEYPVIGIYWPIRGEIDLRELARRHVAAGGIVGLPVVVQKAAPVEFWRWQPGVAMKKGLWNIPVPPDRNVVAPSLLVVPLVGFDRGRYRLGYGGGFYDRTLAAAQPRPHTIGVALADAELPTIYPQSHDIPMDVILTNELTLTSPTAPAELLSSRDR
ncbi:MAG TPA: 5-formyltetrahydrofolate cyclo-ligase [Steroidobacteraceae bacterium]|jgi:5,10-methenyltetrahydrofolate synthetase|nr:5-formyltetrahydrofolate cyclo-ligase [Steroidobacteraceae bacterium]